MYVCVGLVTGDPDSSEGASEGPPVSCPGEAPTASTDTTPPQERQFCQGLWWVDSYHVYVHVHTCMLLLGTFVHILVNVYVYMFPPYTRNDWPVCSQWSIHIKTAQSQSPGCSSTRREWSGEEGDSTKSRWRQKTWVSTHFFTPTMLVHIYIFV